MSLVCLDSHSPIPLTDQIVSTVGKQVDERVLRTGLRLPSIRKFATDHGVSRFTVVQAYDRLVAMGYLHSRQGSGFYVAPRPQPHVSGKAPIKLERAMDVLWLLRNALQQPYNRPMPGAGWLPGSWMDEAGIQRSLRILSRKSGEFLTSYGLPGGYLPLRELLQHRLAEIGVPADAGQIVLTKGASHALDLVARYFIRPGDAVLVDDPGYYIQFGALKSLGAKIVGVPWKLDGPDPAAMEALILEHKPKLFFTNSVLHNPTGASISQAVAYRVLQLAEKYDLLIVEDDIYGDFHPGRITRLATLDQLDRVIYIGSFSKTVSASLRVGYLACKRDIAEHLVDLKLLTGLTTAEIGERMIYQLLTGGYYRKHIDKLRGKLQIARAQVCGKLEKLGLQIYVEPEGGMFIWVNLGEQINVVEMASAAAAKGITLAPGNLFRPHQEPSSWMRFNAAACDDPAVFNFIQGALIASRS
ncbi:MAG: PLP-dependent aminotransferase family protein [Thiobacillus sp.]|nr:PLP-dependent aminotransferase family protein [Thiobacillus sp.]